MSAELSQFFVQIGLVVVFSTLGVIIATLLRQPPVIGLMLAGIVIGPGILGWVHETEIIAVFAELGAVLLLFAIGIEFSINKLLKYGLRAILIGLMKVSIVFFLAYMLGISLGFNTITALYLGAILSITSTAVMIQILRSKNFLYREEVNVLIGSLIVEDILAVFFLTFFSSLGAEQQAGTLTIAYSIGQAVLLLILVYFGLTKLIGSIVEFISRFQKQEDTVLFVALGLGMGLSAIASTLHLSPAIGAFLAGSLAVTVHSKHELELQIKPFILVFSSIFFLSMGLLVDLNSIIAQWPLMLVIAIASILFNFFATSISMYLSGYTSNSAVFSGLAMLSIGEFSLLIAKQAHDTSVDLVGLTSIVVLATVMFNSLVITRHYAVYKFVYGVIPDSVRAMGRNVARKMVGTITFMEQSFFFLRESALFSKQFSLLLGVVVGTILLVLAVRDLNWSVLGAVDLELLIGVVGVAIAAVFLYVIYRTVKGLNIENRLGYRTAYKPYVAVLTLIGFIIIAAFSPFILSILSIVPGWSELVTVLITLAFLLLFYFVGSRRQRHVGL